MGMGADAPNQALSQTDKSMNVWEDRDDRNAT